MPNEDLIQEITELLQMDGSDVDLMDEVRKRTLVQKTEAVAGEMGADREAERIAHTILSAIYGLYVTIPSAGKPTAESSSLLNTIRNLIERSFLEIEERRLPRGLVGSVPSDPEGYRTWFFERVHEHPAYVHPLYEEYLPKRGSAEDLRYLLAQESTIDAATDDFLALTQVGVRGRPKLEMAENYWDEMGNGDADSVHSVLFDNAIRRFGISLEELEGRLEVEALACGNLQLMLSLRRRHVYKAIGYFAVVEYMAPARFTSLMEAWRRLDLGLDGADYHLVHIDVDQQHAAGWFENVVMPLISDHPASRVEIARGAMFRLSTSHRYLEAIFPRFPSRQGALSARG